MMKRNLIIYGTGALAEKIYHYNKRDCLFDIVAFIDDNVSEESKFCGLPIIDYSSFVANYSPSDYSIFVAVGYLKCNTIRELLCKKVLADGYALVNYISPNSICFENVIVGRNILVCDNVFVGHGSRVMDGVILSVGCTLSHENVIEPYCFISSCVAFGGHSQVKNNCFIGLHSTIRDSVSIGAYNIVGCGTNVIRSTENHSVIVGNPGTTTVKDTLSVII